MAEVPSMPSLFQQTSWRVHVGAHKTGSTYFQNLLDNIRHEVNIQHYVDYVPLAVARPIIRRARRESKREGIRLPAERGASTFLELIRPFRRIGKVIAISEENLLGRPVDALSSLPYPNLETNLAFFEHVTQGADKTIFLSIRSFADVVPGAFCTALRFKQVHPTQYQQLAVNCEQSWVKLVQRLESMFPDARVRVFRFEDVIEHPKQVLDTFLNCDTATPANIDIPRQSVRISTKAMDHIAKLDWDVPKREWQRLVEKMCIENPVNARTPKFTFLSQHEITMFNKQYQLDCDFLQNSGNLVSINDDVGPE